MIEDIEKHKDDSRRMYDVLRQLQNHEKKKIIIVD